MRIILLVSLALNLLLLATIVPARVDRSLGSELLDPGEPAARAGDARRLPLGDGEALIEALRAAGLAAGDIKAMLAGWLEARARKGSGVAAPAYWEPGFAPAAATLETELAVAEAVQRGLIALYGDGAVEDPAFHAHFRPLGPAFAFLSPAEQLSLRRHQLTRAPRTADTGGPVAGGACARITLRPAEDAAGPGADELATVLSGAAYQEYRLRFSPLAQSLRHTAVAAGESEFREIFGLLSELEGASTPGALLELRRALRSRMGDAAFDRLWSSLDPLYAAIARHLAAEGFGDTEIANAYSIINRRQESLLRPMSRGADQASLLQVVARQREAEAAELAQLLGESAARGLTAAVTAAAMRLGAGDGGGCPPIQDFQ